MAQQQSAMGGAGNMTGRKMQRMAARGKTGGVRDPRLERLEQLRERLRKKAEDNRNTKEASGGAGRGRGRGRGGRGGRGKR